MAVYSKTCVKRPSKIDKTNILITIGSLMKVESISECFPLEHSAILLTCIKRLLVLKTILGLFEIGRFTQVLLYSERLLCIWCICAFNVHIYK